MYDGDQLNFRPLVDLYEAREFSIYDSHFNIVGYDKPFCTSGHMSMQPPANSVLSEWLCAPEETPTEVDLIWKEFGRKI